MRILLGGARSLSSLYQISSNGKSAPSALSPGSHGWKPVASDVVINTEN